MDGQWSHNKLNHPETFELLSPTGRRVGEIYEESDAISLVELLNDGLKARRDGLINEEK